MCEGESKSRPTSAKIRRKQSCIRCRHGHTVFTTPNRQEMLTRSKRKLEIEVSTRPLDFFDFTELLKADLPTMEFLAEPFKEKDNESFEEYDYGGLDFEDYDGLEYYEDYDAEDPGEHTNLTAPCTLCKKQALFRSMTARMIVEKYKLPVGPRFVGFKIFSFMSRPSSIVKPELNRFDYSYICFTCDTHARKYFHELGEVTTISTALKEQLVKNVSEPIAQIIMAYANTTLPV